MKFGTNISAGANKIEPTVLHSLHFRFKFKKIFFVVAIRIIIKVFVLGSNISHSHSWCGFANK